jgi:hypothetical protein
MKRLALCLLFAACPERVSQEEIAAGLTAAERKPEPVEIVIPKDGLVSFGRNPRRYETGWRIENVAQLDGGSEVHVFCSGRLTILGVDADDYRIECVDSEWAYGQTY